MDKRILAKIQTEEGAKVVLSEIVRKQGLADTINMLVDIAIHRQDFDDYWDTDFNLLKEVEPQIRN